MNSIYFITAFLLSFPSLLAQELVIEEGVGVGPLQLGQSFEEVVHILGFNGDLKTYDDYVAEELFFEDPENSLECAIGFDYYVKYEHLLKLPVSYIYFKDNVITQIKVSSFPEYYFALASDTQTKQGLSFWEEQQKVESIYGSPDLTVNYDSFILESLFYFEKGITFNLREDNYRTAHIYQTSTQKIFDDFKDQF
jgi:hypothetical protein